MKKLLVADLFCGAGGTTSGAMDAIAAIGRDVEFVAVNHWPVAIATHELNHPNVRHYCKDLDTANPCEIVPEGELDLLLASPECRFHSPAQGGRPLDEQNRASAWHVTRWAERLYIRRIVVENVPRFEKWGPLDRKGRPIKNKEGELFLAWVATLEAIGYRVEWRVLNAADYGTPQSRKRLFIQARRDGRRIVWPERTHAPRGSEATLTGELKTWNPARSAINFAKYRHLARPYEEKGLSLKTIARIEEGKRRFSRPFILSQNAHQPVRSDEDVLPTIVATRPHAHLLEPFIVTMRGKDRSLQSVNVDPMTLITTSGSHHALLEPFLIPQGSNGAPFSASDPLCNIMANGQSAHVMEAFIVPQGGGGIARSAKDPLSTVHGDGIAVVEPFLVESNHGKKRPPKSVRNPFPSITRKNGIGVCEPVHDGDRVVWLHRMLQPEELAAGQDLGDYEFTGTREQQTMQIGNAVPRRLARAMTAAAFHDLGSVAALHPKLIA